MSTLLAKADALRADFALPNDAAFPEIVNVVSRQLGKEPPPGTLAEQLDQLYREVHGESGSSSATTGNVANASAAEEPPVVMGVPIGIGTSGAGTAGASASTSGALQSIKTVADAIQEAIAIGAPTYNNGDHFGCYFIYKRVAEEICARLPSAEPTRRALELAVDQAEAQANGGSARRGAWTMRYTFDDLRATPATPVLEGMPTAARLFAEYTPPPAVADARASRAARSACPRSSTAPATTVKGALAAAIEVGAPTYNRGNHAGCFYVYYRTAMEVIGGAATRPKRAPTSPRSRRPSRAYVAWGTTPTAPHGSCAAPSIGSSSGAAPTRQWRACRRQRRLRRKQTSRSKAGWGGALVGV